ncbi:hypothetical protein DIPPA_54847 [Diplonema papillatum]|nr:hypothetical protein DIPPA_54847 [Diplonema papillatum]
MKTQKHPLKMSKKTAAPKRRTALLKNARRMRAHQSCKIAHRRMVRLALVTRKSPMQRAVRQVADGTINFGSSAEFDTVMREVVERYAHDLIQDALKVAKVRKMTDSNCVSLSGAHVETALSLQPHKFKPVQFLGTSSLTFVK